MQSTEKWHAMLRERISELEAESKRIDEELKQLRSIAGTKSTTRKASSTSSKPRAKRGQRRDQFIQAVSKAGSDGVTVSKVAKEINAQAPGLYPLAKKLVEEGIITKKDNLYFLADNKKAPDKSEEKKD